MKAWKYIVQTHLETIRDEAKRWYDRFGSTELTHLEKSDVMWALEGLYDHARKALSELEGNHEDENDFACEGDNGE